MARYKVYGKRQDGSTCELSISTQFNFTTKTAKGLCRQFKLTYISHSLCTPTGKNFNFVKESVCIKTVK